MYDVIIVGAGVQGLSTADYLLENKQNVLVLEQFSLSHTRGSSHGVSRITRHSYIQNHYTEMMPEAFDRWEKLAEVSNTELFKNCGVITIGSKEYVNTIVQNLKSSKVAHEFLNDAGINKKFAGLSCENKYAVFEPSGGVLLADKCLQALQVSIKLKGGKINDNEKFLKLEDSNKRGTFVKVVTNKGTYSAKKVVLTCGSWINKIIKPFSVQYPLEVLKINVLYWKTIDENKYKIENFPSCIIEEDKKVFYSLPLFEYPNCMKVCFHYGVEINPDEPEILNSDVKKALKKTQFEYTLNCVKRYYPYLQPDVAVQENCIYTNTPDEDLILERLPGHPNVIVGAGFSGHGFKLSPTVGRVLGDLAMEKPPKYDLKPFSSSRFNPKSRF